MNALARALATGFAVLLSLPGLIVAGAGMFLFALVLVALMALALALLVAGAVLAGIALQVAFAVPVWVGAVLFSGAAVLVLVTAIGAASEAGEAGAAQRGNGAAGQRCATDALVALAALYLLGQSWRSDGECDLGG